MSQETTGESFNKGDRLLALVLITGAFALIREGDWRDWAIAYLIFIHAAPLWRKYDIA